MQNCSTQLQARRGAVVEISQTNRLPFTNCLCVDCKVSYMNRRFFVKTERIIFLLKVGTTGCTCFVLIYQPIRRTSYRPNKDLKTSNIYQIRNSFNRQRVVFNTLLAIFPFLLAIETFLRHPQKYNKILLNWSTHSQVMHLATHLAVHFNFIKYHTSRQLCYIYIKTRR